MFKSASSVSAYFKVAQSASSREDSLIGKVKTEINQMKEADFSDIEIREATERKFGKEVANQAMLHTASDWDPGDFDVGGDGKKWSPQGEGLSIEPGECPECGYDIMPGSDLEECPGCGFRPSPKEETNTSKCPDCGKRTLLSTVDGISCCNVGCGFTRTAAGWGRMPTKYSCACGTKLMSPSGKGGTLDCMKCGKTYSQPKEMVDEEQRGHARQQESANATNIARCPACGDAMSCKKCESKAQAPQQQAPQQQAPQQQAPQQQAPQQQAPQQQAPKRPEFGSWYK